MLSWIFVMEYDIVIANLFCGGMVMAEILKNDWAQYLNEEFEKEYYVKLRKFLAEE